MSRYWRAPARKPSVWSRPSLDPHANWPLAILVIAAVVAVRLFG